MPVSSQWFAAPAAPSFDTTLIGNSVWLDGSADYLSKTPGSTGDQKRFTFAFWVQRNLFGEAAPGLYSAGDGSQNNDFNIYWNNSGGGGQSVDTLCVSEITGGSVDWRIYTSQLFRDIGWYHIIVSVDTAESTAADRVKIYVNGDQVTSFASASYPSEDADVDYVSDSANEQRIGRNQGANYLNGYITQFTFLDGDSIQNSDVAVSDFLDTQTFGTNGSQKIPKKDSSVAALATAAEGNSYCLDFGDSSALGNDISDEENDFTANSMAAANQSVNTPSLTYPTFNQLTNTASVTFLAGNTQIAALNSTSALATQAIPDGSWYWEIKYAGGTLTGQATGIATLDMNTDAEMGYNSPSSPSQADQRGIYVANGNIGNGFSSDPFTTSYGSGQATDTYIGIAVVKSGTSWKIWFSESGTYPDSGAPASGTNPAFTWTSVYDYAPALGNWSSNEQTIDLVMVSDDWQGTAPTDFLSLSSGNFTAPSYQGIDYFNPVLYAGNGTAIGSGGKAVTGTGFQPDFVWIKNRDAADSHGLYDAVRGTTKQIESDNTAAETTESEGLTTFGSDGFTVGSLDQLNTSSENYVAWQWLGANGTSTDENGSIDSTVTAAGAGHFSVVNWTGDTTLGATVGHGLGGTPEFIIAFNRDTSAENRPVYHKFMTSDNDHLKINEANAQGTAGSTIWDVSEMSSTLIGLGGADQSNGSNSTGCMIAYAFRSVAGVCKVGKYTGNGAADGPFIYTGFKPRYIIWKNISAAYDWGIIDTATQTYNPGDLSSVLFANLNNADGDGTQGASGTAYNIDILADGFKIRVGDSGPNGSGNDMVYMAMADIQGGGTLPPIYGR